MKKKRNKLVITGVAFSSIALLGCADVNDSADNSENDTTEASSNENGGEYRLGMVAAQDSIQHQGAEMFAERVEEKTNGEISIDVFPGGQIGSDESLGQDLGSGNLEFAFLNQGSLSGMDQMLDFHYLPYIVSSYEEADEIYYGDGVIPQTMEETLLDNNIRALGWYELEFRGLSNSSGPVENPEDIDGLQLRVPGSQAIMSFFEEVGAQTVTVAMPELYTALQQGTVDGQDNGLLITYDNNLHETNEYYTRLNHVFATGTIAMSEQIWGNSSEEHQAALEEAAEEAQEWQIEAQRAEVEEYAQMMESEGVEVIELDDNQLETFQEIGMDLWDELEDVYGSENIEELRNEVEEARE
ncbi:TRAP transporter substrate-binding protein [Alkalicoccus saliphilus]|uniref:Transporter n=1 Tax=Alkalicoccus saliphilus TaxID=200989 RepID=A0A2T4U4Q1_9BACI|nr:TRAP transporter substrate-binding protein [Alkalicoccus saliphilus]PTL38381.1 transporter [Alkalicoccus saliphilus]